MNIAITSLYLPSGSKIGVGYVVHYFANEMMRRGHTVTVFSQSGALSDSLYEVVVVPPARKLATFRFAWDLRKYDFSKFDVLNAHGDDWFLWGRKRPRHVHTYHGSCLAEMAHERTGAGRLRMGMLAMCEYNSCYLADVLVGVSENTRRYIPRIQRVIPNGVDLGKFSPSSGKSGVPSLLFVGTMHGRKRGAMLLDVFQRIVRPQVPDAEFWAVCESPVEGDGVRWFGRVSTDELSELYQQAWVFCLPSSYEGFGVPYIEAMASGTAVVSTPNLGALEVMRDGQDGLITSDADLGEALIRVLTDRNLRERLQAAGLQRAEDFSWDRVCSAYEAVYTGGTQGAEEAFGERGSLR